MFYHVKNSCKRLDLWIVFVHSCTCTTEYFAKSEFIVHISSRDYTQGKADDINPETHNIVDLWYHAPSLYCSLHLARFDHSTLGPVILIPKVVSAIFPTTAILTICCL